MRPLSSDGRDARLGFGMIHQNFHARFRGAADFFEHIRKCARIAAGLVHEIGTIRCPPPFQLLAYKTIAARSLRRKQQRRRPRNLQAAFRTGKTGLPLPESLWCRPDVRRGRFHVRSRRQFRPHSRPCRSVRERHTRVRQARLWHWPRHGAQRSFAGVSEGPRRLRAAASVCRARCVPEFPQRPCRIRKRCRLARIEMPRT